MTAKTKFNLYLARLICRVVVRNTRWLRSAYSSPSPEMVKGKPDFTSHHILKRKAVMPRQSISLLSMDMTLENKRRLQQSIGSLQGIYDVEITPRRPTRSSAANRFFHGCICPMLAQAMRDAGNDEADMEMAKEYLKFRLLQREIVNKDTGEVIGHYVKPTHKLDVAEMSKFIDDSINHMADFWNVQVPDPGSRIIERQAK